MNKVENLHGNQDAVLAKFGEDLMILIYERTEAYKLSTAQVVGMLEAVKMEIFLSELAEITND